MVRFLRGLAFLSGVLAVFFCSDAVEGAALGEGDGASAVGVGDAAGTEDDEGGVVGAAVGVGGASFAPVPWAHPLLTGTAIRIAIKPRTERFIVKLRIRFGHDDTRFWVEQAGLPKRPARARLLAHDRKKAAARAGRVPAGS